MRKTVTRCFKLATRLVTKSLLIVVFLLIPLVGCTSTSDNFNTNAIYIDVTVVAERNGQTTVTVVFTAEGKTVMLVSGDSLTVTAYGETKEIHNNGSTISPEYTTTFQRVDASEFVLSLNRIGGDVAAPNTTVTLPDAFDIASPTDNQTFTQQDLLPLTLTGAGIQTDIAINGDCQRVDNSTPVITRNINFSDTSNAGSMTITILEQLLASTTLAEGETCTANVVLSRMQSGSIDTHYRGGSIVARQLRRIDGLTITP